MGHQASTLPCLPFGHRHRRLHGSVRQHGHIVIGLELPGRARECAVEIAAIAHHFAGLVNAGEELLFVAVGIETRVSGIEVPIDLQFLAALHGGISGIRHHRDAAQLLEQMRLLERRKLHGLPDALHLQGFGVVERLDLRIVHRRALHGGVEHAGPFGIHPEDCFAGDNVVLVHRGNLLADVAVFLRLLEAEIGLRGDGKRGGDRHQFAQRGAAVGGGVRDPAHTQRHFGCRHTPLLRGGAFQHQPRGGARLPHRLHEVTDGTGAVGVLRAEPGIADRLLHAHGLPIHIEFFGDHQRQRGPASGAHFGPVRGDHDLAIGLKAEVDAGLPAGGGRCAVGEQIRAQHHGAGGEDGAEEAAAIHREQFDRDARAAMFLVCLAGEARNRRDGLRRGQHGGGRGQCEILPRVFRCGEAGAVEVLHGYFTPAAVLMAARIRV